MQSANHSGFEIEGLISWYGERWKQVLAGQGLTQREYEDLLVLAAHPKLTLGELALELDRSDAQTGRGVKKMGERGWVILEQEARGTCQESCVGGIHGAASKRD